MAFGTSGKKDDDGLRRGHEGEGIEVMVYFQEMFERWSIKGGKAVRKTT